MQIWCDNQKICSSCKVPELSVTFQWGRTDCTSVNAPNTTDEHVFPSATMTSVEMFNYFAEEFELTSEQVLKTNSFFDRS
jgi:hypothetical protein